MLIWFRAHHIRKPSQQLMQGLQGETMGNTTYLFAFPDFLRYLSYIVQANLLRDDTVCWVKFHQLAIKKMIMRDV